MLAALAAVLFPMGLLLLVPQARVLVPGWFGLRCVDRVCVDDEAQPARAHALREKALQRLESKLGRFQSPTMVFGATLAYSTRLGLGRKATFAFGELGIAVSPRGGRHTTRPTNLFVIGKPRVSPT